MSKLKEDRRVKFSKLFLKNSLIDLLESKSISKITIKEICEHADINRATFYAHYSDQYDLLNSIEEEYMENILKDVDLHMQDKSEANTMHLVEGILGYIHNNEKMSRILLSDRGDLDFQKKIMTIVHDHMVKNAVDIEPNSKEYAQFVSSYVISGCVGVLQTWFQNGLARSPHEIAGILSSLTLASLKLLYESKGQKSDNEVAGKRK